MQATDWAAVGVIVALMVPLLSWLFSSMGTLGRIDERTAALVKQTDEQGDRSVDCRREVWGRLDEHGHRLTVVEETIKHKPDAVQ